MASVFLFFFLIIRGGKTPDPIDGFRDLTGATKTPTPTRMSIQKKLHIHFIQLHKIKTELD